MQKVVGSNPISRLTRKPRKRGAFRSKMSVLTYPDRLLSGRGANWCPIGRPNQPVERRPVVRL